MSGQTLDFYGTRDYHASPNPSIQIIMSRNISNQPRTLPLSAFVCLLALGPAGCAPSERSSDFPETEVLQDQSLGSDSVRVLAGSEYQAGWFHRLFFGSHYRDLWASSIAVEQLDLNTFAGGLT
ncbi:MAG: hypothetical protein WBH55_00245, partial [Bacteroidota bacterium]